LSGMDGNDTLDGGTGNDDQYGYWGDDVMYGGDGNDYVSGNDGNDRVYGGAGNDRTHGGPGNDVVSGEAGDDQVYGNDGNDQVIGGAGNDQLYGGNGDDALVAIDDGTGDQLYADAGSDTLWVDESFMFPWLTDSMYGVDLSQDRFQRVRQFANGADRTLDGDMIADPNATIDPDGNMIAENYQNFAGRPLFADAGPTLWDVNQQNRGDCWMLATAASVANGRPNAIRHMVADAGDGTYLVRLGDSFYRMDADLPTWSSSFDLNNAGLGQQDSMWVPIVEKAYAHYLTGGADHSYRSLDGDNPAGAAVAFGLTAVNQEMYGTIFNPDTNDTTLYGSIDGLGNQIWSQWTAGQSVTICTDTFVPDGSPLFANHCYAVTGVFLDSEGNVNSIRLFNPWGSELVVSVEDVYYAGVWVTWGTA
jgi:Calpain family cysteine protease/RTX calcium-binding nonapeptide repeat (4 copies)